MPTPLIEFPADDPERALRFWRGLLGVELAPRGSEPGRAGKPTRTACGLACTSAARGPGDTGSLPYFTVDDMATALERVHELGGSIIHPGERWAVCRDSEGSPFALAASPPALA